MALSEEQREKNRLRALAWYKANRDRARATNYVWREANLEKVRVKTKAWREANAEKIRAKAEIWNRANPEKVRAKYRAYEKANPEKVRAKTRAYYKANKDKIIATAKIYRKINSGKVRAIENRSRRKRYANNPTFRIYAALRRIMARVRKLTPWPVKLRDMLGCDREWFMAWMEIQFKPGMDWSNQSEWHIDHIRPISSFNLNDPLELRRVNHFTNLQPLWAEENMRKGAKWNFEQIA